MAKRTDDNLTSTPSESPTAEAPSPAIHEVELRQDHNSNWRVWGSGDATLSGLSWPLKEEAEEAARNAGYKVK